MGLRFRRRTPHARIEGPALRVRTIADTEAAVETLHETSTLATRTTGALRDVGAAVTRIGSTLSTVSPLREARPDILAEIEVYNLTAVVRPKGAFLPGTYRVTYNRIGRHGRRGTPAPIPLTIHAGTMNDLHATITHDAALHLSGATPNVVVDMEVMGGTIHAHGAPAGTFTLRLVTSHDTDPAPGQETTTP